MASGQLRDSSQRIYESKWSKFAIWCTRRDLDAEQAPVSRVCDFFLFLLEHERLSPSSIEGYRSAINSVWGASGRSLGHSFHVTRLLKSFRVDRPRSAVSFPRWDLNLVLRVLTPPPVPPGRRVSPLLHFSNKVVFLLLYWRWQVAAATSTPSTLIALRSRPRPRYWSLPPRYLLKIRNTAEGEARYAPIVVRFLRSVTSHPKELALCPVAALRTYDAYARRKSPQRSRFFVSLRDDGHPVSKATISAWVVKLLRRAYSEATDADTRLAATSVHEIRALATSLAVQAIHSLFRTS